MNPHYTDETKTIFINSELRVSGNDHDLMYKFPSVLPNQYSHFYCESIDFYGQSVQPNPGNFSRYSPCLDVFDLMETNYNSSEQYNGQTIVPSVVFHAGQQYTRRKLTLPFIAKNFNGKTFRFVVRSAWDAYDASSFASMRNWTLILSVTPIKETQIYHISNKKYESFSYSISSNQIVEGTPNNGVVEIAPIYDSYNEYFVDVKIIQQTQNLIAIDEYVLLYCEGWSETEYSPYGQIIGGLVDATAAANRFDSNPSSDNAVFRIKNMRQKRRIKFKIRYNDLTMTPNNILSAGYSWYINCLITPIR